MRDDIDYAPQPHPTPTPPNDEENENYSSGTGIFKKLYDDGGASQATYPGIENTAEKYKPTYTRVEDTAEKYKPTYTRQETINPVYEEVKNIEPTVNNKDFSNMPGYEEMKNNFDADKFDEEVRKTVEAPASTTTTANGTTYTSVTDRRGYAVGSKITPDMTPENGGQTTSSSSTTNSGPTTNMSEIKRAQADNAKDMSKYKKDENTKSWYQEYYENKKSEETVKAGDLEVNFAKIDRIIEILKEVKDNKIVSARTYVGNQTLLINDIPEFPSAVGRLESSEMYQPLTSLAASIEKLISDYEYIKSEVRKYNSSNTSTIAAAFGTLTGLNKSDSGSGGGSSYNGGSSSTTRSTEAPTEKPTEKPTETPTEKPTEKVTEAPTERPTVPAPTEPTTIKTEPSTIKTEPSTSSSGGPLPSIPVTPGNGGSNGSSGGGYYWNGNNDSVSTETPTVATDPTFTIKEGNKYKLPTSARPTTTPTTTSNKGNSVVPVLAGLAAAAAAGVGAKAYIDRKKNNDNESEEEFKSEDWSTDNDINIEYQEPTTQEAETLEFDGANDNYEIETPEKYGAKTHQELEDLQ